MSHRFLEYLGNIPLPSPSIASNIRSFRSGDDRSSIEHWPTIGPSASGAKVEFPKASHSPKKVDVGGPETVDVYSLPLSVKLEHPTIQVLQKRWESKSKPGKRSDGFKVGLVVEGGGMRGAVTGGMLMQLHSIGMKDAFDVVYGSSAGAMNATYFLSDQVRPLLMELLAIQANLVSACIQDQPNCKIVDLALWHLSACPLSILTNHCFGMVICEHYYST